jgi:hypothetical protein
MPEHLQFFCVRVLATTQRFDSYGKEIASFLEEVAVQVSQLENLKAAA